MNLAKAIFQLPIFDTQENARHIRINVQVREPGSICNVVSGVRSERGSSEP